MWRLVALPPANARVGLLIACDPLSSAVVLLDRGLRSLPGKVRVYELARELGVSNKEIVALSNDLGIGVKSHSSSMEEAQADRVRKKAESEGVAKPASAESPAKADDSNAKVPTKAISTKKAPPGKLAADKAQKPTGPIKSIKEPKPATPPPGAVVSSGGRGSSAPQHIATPPPSRITNAAVPAPARVQRPTPKTKAPQKPVKPIKAVPAEAPVVSKQVQTDADGKPIPPPPPRKIPPPPQNRPGRSNEGGSSAPRTQRPPSGGGFNRSGPGPSFPPSGGPPGGSGARGPGGRGGQRKKKSRGRRSRDEQELQPMDLPTYSAEDAPVPEGVVVIERASTAQDLGPKLNRTAADVVRFLLTNGDMVTATQSLSDEMIELFAVEVGAAVQLVDPGEEQEVELLELLEQSDDVTNREGTEVTRPPVVTVMGHVDHGKTKLLDRIRQANVVEGEAGGITQHIGAYQIEHNGKKITFLDTPGHEAFTAMRARGANATDIVILVVAANDGVMPQTLEALDHATAAEVPIIVAINKIDTEGADPQKVMAQLGERDLVPEAWGGDTVMCEVSALKGEGIDELIESLLVVAELEDLKASPEGPATGVVLESHLDIGRGPVATILVQQGTLSVGDPMVTGSSWGKVRALITDRGDAVPEANLTMPVQVLGLSDVASAGDKFHVSPTEKVASKVADTRSHWRRLATLGREAGGSAQGAKLEDIFNQIQSGEVATLNLIVKADVNGSLEAVCDSLRKLQKETVKLSFMLRGVGGITENDVQLAAASNATIIGFNVRPDRNARESAANEGIEIRTYEIIYKLIEDMEAAMLGMLAPEFEELVTGEAEVREIFRVPKIGAIAGCMVSNGVITRGSKVRFLRDGTIIWKGEIQSLKRFKEDAKEVQSGFECGIGLNDFQDLKQGDVIETYRVSEIEPSFD